MGEMADYFIDQMIDEQLHGYDSHTNYFYREPLASDRRLEAENEMEEFKMAEVKKTYSFDINSEKKIYRIKPPLARGSYMQSILVPEAFDADSEEEWSCQLRWPIDDPEVKLWAADMSKLFKKIFIDKFGEAQATKLLSNPNVRIPLRNGNQEPNEDYAGWLFMNVRNKFRQPVVLGPHGKAIPGDMVDENVIYSGAWYRSRITLKHFNIKGHVVGSFLDILMKVKDDQRLDNVIDVGAAESDFADFAVEDAGMDEAAQGLDGDDNPFADGGGSATGSNQKKDEDDDFSFLE